MDAKNPNLTFDGQIHSAAEPARHHSGDRPVRPWVNWGLALSTVPAAAIVMLFALGAVMSTDGCTDRSCPHLGRGGIAVPLCGWALLVADVALMAATVAS